MIQTTMIPSFLTTLHVKSINLPYTNVGKTQVLSILINMKKYRVIYARDAIPP